MPPQPKRLCDLPAHRDSKRNRPDNDGSVMDRPIEKPTMQGKKVGISLLLIALYFYWNEYSV